MDCNNGKDEENCRKISTKLNRTNEKHKAGTLGRLKKKKKKKAHSNCLVKACEREACVFFFFFGFENVWFLIEEHA